jgi:hypothetical protein
MTIEPTAALHSYRRSERERVADLIVGSAGRAADVALQVLAGMDDKKDIFKTPVGKNLRDSKFSAACAGRTVTLVFAFIYNTRSERFADSQMVTFVAPNRFEISVMPGQVMR